MANLEVRLQKLETFQDSKRKYTDTELAVRIGYLLHLGKEKAPPGVWELLERLGFTKYTT